MLTYGKKQGPAHWETDTNPIPHHCLQCSWADRLHAASSDGRGPSEGLQKSIEHYFQLSRSPDQPWVSSGLHQLCR